MYMYFTMSSSSASSLLFSCRNLFVSSVSLNAFCILRVGKEGIPIPGGRRFLTKMLPIRKTKSK